MRPWVVKLGGSIDGAGALPGWLAALRRVPQRAGQARADAVMPGQEAGAPAEAAAGSAASAVSPPADKAALTRVVVVPGGGVFADTVRAQQRRHGFDDSTAHSMALLAMDQYGLQLIALAGNDLQPVCDESEMARVLQSGAVAVWLPSRRVDREPVLERSWNLTSDSLALWLAGRVHAAGVVLVKSVAVGAGRMAATEAAQRGWVDAAFADQRARLDCPVRLVGPGDERVLDAILSGAKGGLELF